MPPSWSGSLFSGAACLGQDSLGSRWSSRNGNHGLVGPTLAWIPLGPFGSPCSIGVEEKKKRSSQVREVTFITEDAVVLVVILVT